MKRNLLSRGFVLLFASSFILAVKANAQASLTATNANPSGTTGGTWTYASQVTNNTTSLTQAQTGLQYNLQILSPFFQNTGTATETFTFTFTFDVESKASFSPANNMYYGTAVSSSKLTAGSTSNSNIFPYKTAKINSNSSYNTVSGSYTVSVPAGSYAYFVLGDGQSYPYYVKNISVTVSTSTGSINGSTLPVNLAEKLTAVADNAANTVALSWATASEINNKGFWVERSSDGGKTWSTPLNNTIIASRAQNGNSSAVLYYNYTDASPLLTGVNTYRLMQEDLDGATENIGIVAVQLGNANTSLSLYPNPVVSGTLYLKNAPTNASYRIINAAGQTVVPVTALAGNNSIEVRNLSAGYYLLVVSANSKTETLKFIKK